MSGEFDVVLEAFKTDREAAKKMARPLIRLKSDEFITSAGLGRWFNVSPELYAKLDDDKYLGRTYRIKLAPGSRIEKLGRIPSEAPSVPVDTNPQPTISAAASRRASVRRSRTTHKNAPTSQTVTQTNVPTDLCPSCNRRFSMVGKGQRGLCAACAPKAGQKAS